MGQPWWKDFGDKMGQQVRELAQKPSPPAAQLPDSAASASPPPPPGEMSDTAWMLVVTLLIGGLLLLSIEAYGYYRHSDAEWLRGSSSAAASGQPSRAAEVELRAASAIFDDPDVLAASVTGQASYVKPESLPNLPPPPSAMTMRPGAATMMDQSYVNVPADLADDFEMVGRS